MRHLSSSQVSAVRTRSALGTITVGVAAIVAAAAVAPVGVRAETGTAEAGPSPCVAEYERAVRPDLILVGESVRVAMHVRPLCAGEALPLHAAIVLDASASMAGPKERQLREAATDIVSGLFSARSGKRRAAVVEFGRDARTVMPMSGDEAHVLSAVRNVQARRDPYGDETAIDRGLLEARRALVAARGPAASPQDITELMAVLSDGHDPRGCRPALGEARAATLDGVVVMAACIGWGCDEACLRQVASSPRTYHGPHEAGALGNVFERPGEPFVRVHASRLVIEETPDEGLAYEPDSAEPPPSAIDRHTGSMRREFDDVPPRDGVSVTYRARVIEPGQRTVATASSCWLEDSRGRQGAFRFPALWLSAWGPDRLAASRFGLAPGARPPIATLAVPLPVPTAEVP